MLSRLEQRIAEALATLSAEGVSLRVGPGPAPADGPTITIVGARWRARPEAAGSPGAAQPAAGRRAEVRLRLVAWGRTAARADSLLARGLALTLPALTALESVQGGAMAGLRLRAPTLEIRGERRGYAMDSRLCWAEARLDLEGALEVSAAEAPRAPVVVEVVAERVMEDAAVETTSEAAPAPPPAPEPAPAPAPRTGPRPIESVPPVRLKALGDTSAKHLQTLFNVTTLAGLAALPEAAIDTTALSGAAKSTLKSGRAQAVRVLGLALSPLVPEALSGESLSALASLSAEGLTARLLAAAGQDSPELREAASAMRAQLVILGEHLDAAWFTTDEARVSAMVPGV